MRQRVHVVVALALLALGPAAGVARADGSLGTLSSTSERALWSGHMTTGAVADPALCSADTCDTRTVKVQLPAGEVGGHPTGMLVAVDWDDDELDVGYDLDIYVYAPDGSLAASSTMFQYSTGEAAWVQAPINGDYRIVVTDRGELGDTDYRGAVTFQRGIAHKLTTTLAGVTPWVDQMVAFGEAPSGPQLPDLVPLPAHNYHMETTLAASFYIAADRGLRHAPSCNPQETTDADSDAPDPVSHHPTRCLRFDSDLVNAGAGPYEIRAYPNNGSGTDAYQVVYNGDGSYSEHIAGEAIFSNAHGHVHFKGFDDTGLYTIASDGSPGKLLQLMPDKGRCALDTHNARFGEAGDAPMHYVFPSTCDQADNVDPADPVYPGAYYFRSGVSAGWNDEYPWFIPDQYIDVTGVHDGRYLIVSHVNASHVVEESDYSNDTALACVELAGDSAKPCPLPAQPQAAAATPAKKKPAAKHKRHHRSKHHKRKHHRRKRHHRS